MAQTTNIEWTDATWNPTRGCRRVSPGCLNCYAEKIAARFSGEYLAFEGFAKRTAAGPRWTGRIDLIRSKLDEPLRRRRWAENFALEHGRNPRMFANSMSDLFALESDEEIDRVFAHMALSPWFTHQVLTKRADRMPKYFANMAYRTEMIGIECESISGLSRYLDDGSPRWPLPLPNVWLGVSIENQETADERLPYLINTPAAVRMVSAEPLLGPVDLRRWSDEGLECQHCAWGGIEEQCQRTDDEDDWEYLCPRCEEPCAHTPIDEYWGEKGGIGWLIVGGESGDGARPMHPDWARSLRDQCQAAGAPFFFKQWGEWLPVDHVDLYNPLHWRLKQESALSVTGSTYPIKGWRSSTPESERVRLLRRVGKKAAGRLLDGVEHSEFPEAQPCAYVESAHRNPELIAVRKHFAADPDKETA